MHNTDSHSKEAVHQVVEGHDGQARREEAGGSPVDLQGRLVMREPRSTHAYRAQSEALL